MSQKARLLFWTENNPREHLPLLSELSKTYDIDVLHCMPAGDVKQRIDATNPVGCIAHCSLGSNMHTMTKEVGEHRPTMPIIEIRAQKTDQPRVPHSFRRGLTSENEQAPAEIAAYVKQQLRKAA
jgi:hypothetical protein